MKTIKKTNEVTVTDITIEAKTILSKATSGFTSPEYQKMAYLRERKFYWLDNGFNEFDAIAKAQEDYEWSFEN